MHAATNEKFLSEKGLKNKFAKQVNKRDAIRAARKKWK